MWVKKGVVVVILVLFHLKSINAEARIIRDVMNGTYGVVYDLTINSSHEHIFEYRTNTKFYPTRVRVESRQANTDYPILVVAQQQKGITSWQIPMVTDLHSLSLDYRMSSHTLCPETLHLFRTEATQELSKKTLKPGQCSNPTVIVKTLSPTNVAFKLDVRIEDKFFLKADTDYSFVVSPSEPVYYYYNFHDEENMANRSDAVLVTANSDTHTCMLFSIQNSTCPVLDLENNIKYDSYWQTMSKKAAIVITKKSYPDGFFVVMVVKHSDEECNEQQPINFILGRTKSVNIKITPTITFYQHNVTAFVTLAIFALLLLIAMIGGIFYFIHTLRQAKKVVQEAESTEGMIDGTTNFRWTQLCTLSCSDANRNASNYVWLVTIVILFYILPVLQVAVTYQGIVNDTGNDDLCYYNFLCALPHKFLTMRISDFNHVLSNIGYIFLGIVFVILTHLQSLRECTKQKEGFGLMKPYGMFYAMGIALVMEGIMSACYHICPKKSNFQFDTSFMYVMTVLMIVNVYESRRKDMGERTRDERGYVVFFTLAGVTAISVIGSYAGTKNSFWIIITILHILTCMFLTWTVENIYIKQFLRKAKRNAMNYIDITHGLLLMLINAANIALAIFGLLMKYSFATHVLTVLITNGVLYTMFYIIMKMIHREKILRQTPILIILSLLCWVPALYFFLTTVTTWEETPAQSRNRNQECMLVKYYDSHDVWHFLSAFALFFTCWILLTLDEGLDSIPRADIVDFHAERRKTSNERVVIPSENEMGNVIPENGTTITE